MSYMRDRSNHTRGAGAVAAVDVPGARNAARARGIRMSTLRDGMLAGLTFGPAGGLSPMGMTNLNDGSGKGGGKTNTGDPSGSPGSGGAGGGGSGAGGGNGGGIPAGGGGVRPPPAPGPTPSYGPPPSRTDAQLQLGYRPPSLPTPPQTGCNPFTGKGCTTQPPKQDPGDLLISLPPPRSGGGKSTVTITTGGSGGGGYVPRPPMPPLPGPLPELPPVDLIDPDPDPTPVTPPPSTTNKWLVLGAILGGAWLLLREKEAV